ncbi:MAG: hypothetical protein OEZ58_14120 [Gammaproteobacteria bacterium]|nr:hypothetical protein [Gammaproteobacteria bacterium]MDH5730127.1 hypothetical protein [Gammaproteobacteria bacterium]
MKRVKQYSFASIIFAFSDISLANVEDWYMMWGFGIASHSHAAATENYMKVNEIVGSSRTQNAIDMFGIYFPMGNDQTIVGFVVNGTYDSVQNSSALIQYNYYNYAISTLHFTGKEPGDGFFLRADVGKASSVLVVDNYYENSFKDIEGTWGIVTGIGYGLPITPAARILVGLNYTLRNINKENEIATEFIVDLLW